MKREIKTTNQSAIASAVLMLAILMFTTHLLTAQSVGINTDNPKASAQLDIKSTQSGFLIPRMSVAGRDSIPAPAVGLMIYNTDSGTLDLYGGDGWYQMQREQVSTSTGSVTHGGVAFNNSGAACDSSAIADVSSAQRGFLLPRVAALADISAPDTGLIVYDTTNHRLSFYDGMQWKSPLLDNHSTVTGSGSLSSQGVVIGANTPAHPSAMLEIRANNKGLLTPRMTAAQRDQLAAAEGLIIYNTTDNEINYWDGGAWYAFNTGFSCGDSVTFVYNGSQVTYGTVYNPSTGKCWLDRNLGATQVASSSTDAAAYGDLFQWGRGDDGHQQRSSATTSVLASNSNPGHSSFITVLSAPYDWQTTQNDTLWQNTNGANNPCPSGFRLPTETELDDESKSWSSNNASGAFGSPLKLPMSGYRLYDDAGVYSEGSHGPYWSSSTSGSNACYIGFGSNSAGIFCDPRAFGLSVRCIRD
ncbi:MAG: hypothetical protein ACQESZ_06465 [Bacteroidota bacterium]